MNSLEDISDRVRERLRRFLHSSDRATEKLTDQTNLFTTLGLSSDEGLDLVLDLCDEFQFDFPGSFNPVVHPDGKRGNSVGELIAEVRRLLPAREVHR